MTEINYPIAGYAPGNYSQECSNCLRDFMGDKYATTCEPCAINYVNARYAELNTDFGHLKQALLDIRASNIDIDEILYKEQDK